MLRFGLLCLVACANASILGFIPGFGEKVAEKVLPEKYDGASFTCASGMTIPGQRKCGGAVLLMVATDFGVLLAVPQA
jgi:hypothetical protein